MIKEIVKDILQAESKEILPDIVTTILQQIKESANQLLCIVKDVPGQTKPMNMDKMSVLIQTTQGASKESLSDPEAITPRQSEEEVILLTQEDAEKQQNKKPDAKSNTKKQPITQETQSRKNLLLQNRRSP
eukprot:5357466-Ditylum_brightwellii.AAC.1